MRRSPVATTLICQRWPGMTDAFRLSDIAVAGDGHTPFEQQLFRPEALEVFKAWQDKTGKISC